jgi:Zn-dependent protease
MMGNIGEIAIAVFATILAITLHEAAHGYAAWALGDDTAKKAGRLSLNPIAHIDRFGTIILPGMLLIFQMMTIGHVAFMFGWAKPVPVSAWRFKRPRQMMLLVAAAGPLMNFFLAWLGGLGAHALDVLPPFFSDPLFVFIQYFIEINIVLGLFNLLPIPPMDGGRIVVGLLPEAAARRYAGLERYGLIILLLLMFIVPEMSRDFGRPIDPVRDLLERTVPQVQRVILMLSGNDADD